MDYLSASAEDFTKDAYFKHWVLAPNDVSNSFWLAFINDHPEKASEIEEAREYILFINSNYEDGIDTVEIESIKDHVHQAIFGEREVVTSSVENQRDVALVPERKTSWIYKVAVAAAVFPALIAATYYIVKLDRFNTKHEVAQAQVETQRGQRSFITLSDGTRIWLNADSHVKYEKNFGKSSTREIYLDGEAFFDVAEDKSKPFIVHTSHISIKVLGTAFNVRSFAHDPIIETTLVRGKVTIHNNGDAPDAIVALLPSDQAVYAKDSKKLTLSRHIATDDFTSWKEGELVFDEKPLPEIVKDLERWYDVKIHMENVQDQNCAFSGRFKNEPLVEVLGLFKSSDGVSFEIKNRDVFITGNPCNN